MKATGIVRRVDDLGRVVIPKELRRTLHIGNGAQLEIFTGEGGDVIFRKFSPVAELGGACEDYIQHLARIVGKPAAVCDLDRFLCATGAAKKELTGLSVESALSSVLSARRAMALGDQALRIGHTSRAVAALCPILANSQLLGAVLLLDGEKPGSADAACELPLLTLTASFIALQLGD